VKGELEIPNVKSMDVFLNEDDPDITHIQFETGELSLQIDLTAEQHAELRTQLDTSIRAGE